MPREKIYCHEEMTRFLKRAEDSLKSGSHRSGRFLGKALLYLRYMLNVQPAPTIDQAEQMKRAIRLEGAEARIRQLSELLEQRNAALSEAVEKYELAGCELVSMERQLNDALRTVQRNLQSEGKTIEACFEEAQNKSLRERERIKEDREKLEQRERELRREITCLKHKLVDYDNQDVAARSRMIQGIQAVTFGAAPDHMRISGMMIELGKEFMRIRQESEAGKREQERRLRAALKCPDGRELVEWVESAVKEPE